jgi:hypothetical protein
MHSSARYMSLNAPWYRLVQPQSRVRELVSVGRLFDLRQRHVIRAIYSGNRSRAYVNFGEAGLENGGQCNAL